MTPVTLALDISTHTGWALARDDINPICGVWHLGEPGAELGLLGSRLWQAVASSIRTNGVQRVILEAPLPQQERDTQRTARLLIGLALVAEIACYECGKIPCEEQLVGKVRQLVLGKGSATKDDVVKFCEASGWHPPDHNAADALVLLRYRLTLDRMHVQGGAPWDARPKRAKAMVRGLPRQRLKVSPDKGKSKAGKSLGA